VREERVSLRAAGGLCEAHASVLHPRTVDELSELFAHAATNGHRLTLIGSQRSFGEHFLPTAGARGVALTGLAGNVASLEETDADVWVRVPGALSFEALCRAVPGCVPFNPPTGDRISVGGALAACSHNAVDFLATDVRAFRLLAPNGRLYSCARGKPGLEGELFDAVPGSFGALGAIVDLELRMRRIHPGECAEIRVLERCPTPGYAALERLERCYQAQEYPLGRGLFFFGRRGPSVLLGDRIVVAQPGERARPLLLLDDATERNIVAQALANRWPLPAHRLQPFVFKPDRRFRADLYAFSFYQRSYDRAQAYLASSRSLPRILRALGVDPWLGVCHQSWVIPVDRRRAFLDLYFGVFDEFAELESYVEQQDLIRLPPCPWPLHGAHGMPGGSYVLTVSISVQRGEPIEQRARAFFVEVSRRAYAELGVPVLLLKQAHLDDALLRSMHRGTIDRLARVKGEVDPNRVLGSRLLARLGLA
jgi:FAD/FMN-containing dehydrogenase